MNTVELKRSRGFTVIMDEEDFIRLSSEKIYIKVNPKIGRAVATKYISSKAPRYKTWYLSRLLLNAPEGMEVDHINGNKLDNRKENLRICTKSENRMNRRKSSRNNGGTSRSVGVYKAGNRWAVDIRVKRKLVWRGFFEKEIDAANEREIQIKKFHGEFAKSNFK